MTKDKNKDERTVTTEDIVSGLYVELLASDINRVKLNRIYRENEEQAYLKMKTSKLNEYKFIKQATIKKTVEFKKAIGLIELMKEYENSLDMKYVRETDEKDMDSDVLTKIRFIEELGGIVLGTYKGLEDALRKEDYRDIAVKLAKSAKNSKYNLEFAITGLLFCKNEAEFTKIFDKKVAEGIRQLLIRGVDWQKPDFKEVDGAIELRNEYLPDKKFHDFYKLGQHIKRMNGVVFDKDNYGSTQFEKYIVALQSVAEIFDIEIDVYTAEHNLSRDEINGVFSYLAMAELEDDDWNDLFVFSGFIISFLCKEINRSKELFFENNDEMYELEKRVVKASDEIKDKRIEELERVIRDRDIEIDRLKKEYRVGLEREIIELEGLVENLEWVIDELESTSQVQDRVQVEVRDKDAINKNEVAQLGLSPLQDIGKGNCEVDCEIDYEIDYEAEIYVIGGYDRLINKLRAKFVNMVSDEKGYKGFVGKERVFILTGYVSHADIYKIESLGIYGKFVNSKGINGIVREIESVLERECK